MPNRPSDKKSESRDKKLESYINRKDSRNQLLPKDLIRRAPNEYDLRDYSRSETDWDKFDGDH